MWVSMLLLLAVMACRSPVIEGTLIPLPPYLEKLRLSGIQGLTGLSFEYVIEKNMTSHLRTLDLGHNDIEDLSWMESKFVPQLTWLSLTNNALSYISPHTFNGLENLEYLDLSDNALYTLEGIFDSLKSLQRLNIAGNKVEHVQAESFKNLSKLVELDISRNRMTFIPADTLQPLVSLSVFKLAENPLIQRDLSLLLGTGRRLETVDASRIGLIRVPAALTHSVRTLKLSGNRLTSINSGDLDSYPLLISLDLSDNRLMIIEEDALGRLDNLKELILAGNILPTIPKSLPSGLKSLNLSQNAISKLKANDFQGLVKLKELNLSGNVISEIQEGSFGLLSALEKLDISDNPIKKLSSDALSGPTTLVTLRMSGLLSLQTEENQNHDTAFPFLTPERLVTLDVSRSPALAAQLLADNAALSACKSLKELNLSYTNITAIRSDLAYVLPQLQILNLIGNEWNCTDQFWIGEWIRNHKQSIPLSTRCRSPPSFEGTLLEKLPKLTQEQPKTTKYLKIEIIGTTLKATGIELTTPPTASELFINKTQEEKKVSRSSPSTQKTTVSKPTITTENSLKVSTEKITSTTSIMKSTTYPKSESEIKDSTMKNVTEEHKTSISSSISSETEKPITTIHAEEWLNPSTTSIPEEYTSKDEYHETIKASADTIINIAENKQNQDQETVSATSNDENVFSTTDDKEMATKEITNTPSTKIIEITSTTTPSTSSSTKASTTKQPNTRGKQAVINESMVKKVKKNGGTPEVHKRNSESRIAELSHSKMLVAQIDEEPKSFAEELNSQATESGARTSESLASGAHPGMLVLLGAAIGAAAALTVVLSRRATVRRRDRQYQRHENIEVHALTPTTELW